MIGRFRRFRDRAIFETATRPDRADLKAHRLQHRVSLAKLRRAANRRKGNTGPVGLAPPPDPSVFLFRVTVHSERGTRRILHGRRVRSLAFSGRRCEGSREPESWWPCRGCSSGTWRLFEYLQLRLPHCVLLLFHSTYRKYAPAAYASVLKIPNTPAAIFDEVEEWCNALQTDS